MTELDSHLRMAERLQAITQQVGFVLWQLQELEGATAQYFVLVALATKGMGLEAGMKLDESAKEKTFGTTIHALRKVGKMPEALETRFLGLLKERNWLVHSYRASSRTAVLLDAPCEALLRRLEWIADEARLLLKEVAKSTEQFVFLHGVSAQEIERLTSEILASWSSENAAKPFACNNRRRNGFHSYRIL